LVGGTVELPEKEAGPLVAAGVAESTSVADAGQSPAPEVSVPSPERHDRKAAWVAYAVSEGADRSEAEGMTKSELIDGYGQL
jgi:hypothetical protein